MRKPILYAALGALAFAAPAAFAKMPCSTAKLIVPWKAGGETDLVNRIVADLANKKGAEPRLQVVNIAGQGGNKGAKEAKAAAPDGCTLFAIHQSAIASYFTGRVDFSWSAFEPVALMVRTPPIIGANPGVPYDDVRGLVRYAKANPDKVLVGATLGSTSQFWFLLLEDAAGVKFRYVPYDGTRERMTALLAGNVNIGEVTLAAAKKYIQTNQLKAVGIYTAERNAEIPNVPTLKEEGVDLVAGTDRGIVAPKGTPPDVVRHWADVLQKVADDPEFVREMKTKGTVIVFKRGADYQRYMDQTFDKWERLAKKVGVYKRKD